MINSGNFAGIKRDEVNKFKGLFQWFLIYLIMHVNFADNPDFLFNNKPYPLKRGQLITSRKSLAEGTGLSEQVTKTFLKNLRNLKILTNQSTGLLTNRATLITFTDIDKWLIKQGEITNQTTNQVTNDQPTTNQPLTTNNKNKEELKKKSKKKVQTPAIAGSKPINNEVSSVVDYLSLRLGKSLDGSIGSNRQYAWNLLGKIRRDYQDADPVTIIKQAIDAGFLDEFYATKLTTVKFLYYNFQKIAGSFKEKVNNLPISV